MASVRRGAPASGVEKVFFLAGVPVDPVEVTYAFAEPGGSAGVDEDGITIADRVPLRSGAGRYHTGNTVLPLSAATGAWTVEWTYRKVTGGPELTATEPFEVVDTAVEEPTREAVTRRDVPDTANLLELRTRIQDRALDDTRWAFFNSELQTFLDRAIARHTRGQRSEATASADDLGLAMLLAHAAALHALATDRSKFFRWQDQGEAVDKSMQPRMLVDIARNLIAEYEGTMKRRLEEEKAGRGGREVAGELLTFRRS
jgi:hypothetical protein